MQAMSEGLPATVISFAVRRQLLYSQVREDFQGMADVERFHLYPHLNRILRTGIMRREDSVTTILN